MTRRTFLGCLVAATLPIPALRKPPPSLCQKLRAQSASAFDNLRATMRSVYNSASFPSNKVYFR